MIYLYAYELFSRLQKANPQPKTELEYINPFTLLIAVVLSAQATDKGVNKATATLFQVASTPKQMVELGLDALKNYIKTINFYNNKAKNIITLSEILIQKFQREVPNDRQALESLPGVGRKTANVILNIAFGINTIAVDTHIFRVANRTGLAPGRTVFEVEKGLEKIVPTSFFEYAHHWLILHGRYICIARKPKCDICPIYDLCDYYKNSHSQAVD